MFPPGTHRATLSLKEAEGYLLVSSRSLRQAKEEHSQTTLFNVAHKTLGDPRTCLPHEITRALTLTLSSLFEVDPGKIHIYTL